MSKPIEEYTSEELYKLAENKREQEKIPLRPKVVCSINCSGIQGLVDLAETFLQEGEDVLEIDTRYAYEALMEFVYGDEVWPYINCLEDNK